MPPLRNRYLMTGVLWLAVYLALAFAPLKIVFTGEMPPRRDLMTEFAVGVGFAALAGMCLQFVLTARFKWLKAPYGSDVVYNFHRVITFFFLGFVFVHPLLLYFTPARDKVLVRFDLLNFPLFPRWGFYAALALIALVATSLGRERLKISYEGWRRSHALLAVLAVVFSSLHIVSEQHYLSAPLKQSLWFGYTFLWVGMLAWIRVIKPRNLLRAPYVVEEIRQERGHSWTLALSPVGHRGMAFSPGQFAWLSLFHSPFSAQEHPFSFSGSAEKVPRLEFTIKALGDFTRRVSEVHPGERVWVDGPFGAISADRHPRSKGFVLIAGGIGITPMMSHLRTFADRGEQRPVVLIYGTNDWERTTFREEIEALRTQLDLRVVHVLANPPEGWPGERGMISRELLQRHTPAPEEGYEYFICGPLPMMNSVEKALYRLGVPFWRFHSERFSLV